MTHQYAPMLPSTAERPFSSPDWLFEVKWDGVRAIAYVRKEFALLSRNGNDLAARFPELRELSDLAPGTVLDGEIIVMRDGKPDIQALLPRLQAEGGPPRGALPVTYIVFDILEKGGEPLIALPLAVRRKILEESVREGSHVILSQPIEEHGAEYYRAAVAQGLEGIMAKRKGSPYEPGVRSRLWLKFKADKTCDCIIAGYTRGQGARSDTFGALLLALYDNGPPDAPKSPARTAPLVYIGKVGSGFSDNDIMQLMQEFSRRRSDTPALDDVHGEGQVTWLRPELVCEVVYQQATRDHRLRIPRFRRLRNDRLPGDCRTDQLELQPVPGKGRDDGKPVQPGPATRTMRIADGGIDAHAGTKVRRHGAAPRPPTILRVTEPEEWERASPAPFAREQGNAGNGDSNARYGSEKPAVDERTPGTRVAAASLLQPTEKYRGKRNFRVTPEPEGTALASDKIFVIQEHKARHLHYDFRIGHEGVLKSWAVPKGVPEAAGVKHLAVAVEDHPLDYATFEGTIPEGEYGAGTVAIWDTGPCETLHWDEKKIEVILHGKRIDGHYVLVPFHRAGKNEWLIFKAGS